MTASAGSIVKVRVVSDERTQASNILPLREDRWAGVGAIVPPHPHETLFHLYEHSSALRPNIDAYATNIEAFGHRLQPTIDLDASDANDKIRDALILERICDGELPAVTDEDVAAARIEMESVQRIEKMFLEAWLADCSDISFVQLRRRMRQDLEICGNAYWEVVRTNSGRIGGLNHIPAITMRLMPADRELTEVDARRRVSAMSYRRLCSKRRFRKFVQLCDGVQAVYFKTIGDPRVFSSRSGRRYASVEELCSTEEGVSPATEIIHFTLHSSTSAYGVHRWVGATPAIVGTRESEEVNVLYFKDNCIPPMAVTVENGALGDGAVERLKEVIQNNKGRRNFTQFVILEAERQEQTALGPPKPDPKITITPLAQFQNKDALFQVYEQNNAEKIGQQFRLPRILRGLMTDFNRATADSALQYTEQQVFQPERQEIDHLINKLILTDLGIRFWRFESAGPVVRDPPALMDMVSKAVAGNILTPGEGRKLLSDVFGREFQEIDEDWTKQPVAMLTKQTQPAGSPVEQAASGILAVRAAIEQQERGGFEQTSAAAQQADAEEESPEIIELPSEQFRRLLAG